MPDDPTQSVAQADEQDFSIPGQQDDTGDFSALGKGAPQQQQAAPVAPATAPSAPASPVQVDTAQKVHPHVAILAGLVNKILSGVQNAPGNPNNVFDRGFMQAAPQQQQMRQAQVQKAQSEADIEKMQVGITGMKALQYEYMVKRLPQELQEQHLQAASNFKQALIKEGASVEVEADDEKAADTQAFHLNGTDQRATSHAGRFYSLPTLDADGKAKYDVVYVPNKDVLQDDFKWTDGDGNEHVIAKGTPFSGALGKFVEEQGKSAQNQTKAEHTNMANALKPNVPEGEINQTVNWLEQQQKQNTPLYQQNKAAVDGQIASLRAAQKETQAQKERQAAASATRIEEKGLKGRDVIVHGDDGEVLMSSKEAQDQGFDDFSTLTATKAQDLKDKRANADASMNALTQYEETFKNVRPKLSPADRDALKIIASGIDEQAKSGGLGEIIENLPLAGPLSEYVNTLAKKSFKPAAYQSLSPAGKELANQYALAQIANFANMKQMLGSVGRNPMMIQAEMGTIPPPYMDPTTGANALELKRKDLEKRNSSIPKVFSKRDEKLKKQLEGMTGPKSQD